MTRWRLRANIEMIVEIPAQAFTTHVQKLCSHADCRGRRYFCHKMQSRRTTAGSGLCCGILSGTQPLYVDKKFPRRITQERHDALNTIRSRTRSEGRRPNRFGVPVIPLSDASAAIRKKWEGTRFQEERGVDLRIWESRKFWRRVSDTNREPAWSHSQPTTLELFKRYSILITFQRIGIWNELIKIHGEGS
jgi:hypothetical protein